MEIGKLPNKVLEDLVISTIKNRRPEVVERSAVGKDCAIVDYGDKYCVLSSDPITGAEKNLGKIAVNVACNDIAAGGAEPIALLITILAPPDTTEKTIKAIMVEADEESRKLNVEIVGGHTEITSAVNKIILSMTAVGVKEKETMVTTSNSEVGDVVLMTKMAGLEGTAIIAEEKQEELLNHGFSKDDLVEASAYLDLLSVVKEGLICAKIGINYMHDITEGGVEGAVWEASKAIGQGISIRMDKIPVSQLTEKICNHYHIDYKKLISSGSMLVICSANKANTIEQALTEQGILVTQIGKVTANKVCYVKSDNTLEKYIDEPGSDELYKVV